MAAQSVRLETSRLTPSEPSALVRSQHVHDFLFHRTDLAGAKRDRKFLTFDDYKMLKAELDAAGPEVAPSRTSPFHTDKQSG